MAQSNEGNQSNQNNQNNVLQVEDSSCAEQSLFACVVFCCLFGVTGGVIDALFVYAYLKGSDDLSIVEDFSVATVACITLAVMGCCIYKYCMRSDGDQHRQLLLQVDNNNEQPISAQQLQPHNLNTVENTTTDEQIITVVNMPSDNPDKEQANVNQTV